MENTLSERLKKAMAGPPKAKGTDLARAAGVATASVSDWKTGKSKSMDGPHLIAVAEFLGVRAKWLAEGVGPMKPDNYTIPRAEEPSVVAMPKRKQDKLTEELLSLFSQLDTASKQEVLSNLRGFVSGRRPHTFGKASNLAG